MLCIVQYAFQSLDGWDSDRSRRQTCILVGIIRRVHFQMFEKNAFQSEFLQTKFYRRVCLQQHPFIQSVDVKSCDHGLFRTIGRFFLHDRGQSRYFFRSKSDTLSLFQPFTIPKGGMFFLHPFHKSVSTHIPIHLVSVRNKKGGECLLGISHLCTISTVGN